MELRSSLEGLGPEQMQGFFEGWPNPPSPQTLHHLLSQSYRVSLAVKDGQVVGVAHAISDGVLTAFIPMLEVLSPYRGRGVGSTLMGHLLAQLDHLYAVDLSCDDALVPFYERLGLRKANAMVVRNYARQEGAPPS